MSDAQQVNCKLNGKKSPDGGPVSVKRRNSLEIQTPEGEVSEAVVEEEDAPATEENVTKEHRQGLLKVLTKAIGLDVTSITLPVTLNEPASFLMRLCEQLQYSDLLDTANILDDSSQRLLYVSLFAISIYAVAERVSKPFNPLLGETFEYSDPKRHNFKFMSEQVSHHPPIGSCFAENDNFKYWTAQQLKTKFTGNALDCVSLGSSNVVLKSWDEHFRWQATKTTVHNIIVGKIWIDHHGEVEIKNKKTGERSVINFTKCGWFSKGWHEVSGTVYDAKGTAVIQISGKWNETLYGKLLTPIPDAPNMTKKEKQKAAKEQKKELQEFKKMILKNLTSEQPLWEHTYKAIEPSKLPCRFMSEWTEHSLLMCAMSDELRKTLPPTDSRIRADRAALEREDTKRAAIEKNTLEERQREQARARAAKNQVWQPKYFTLSKEDEHDWDYNYNYWSLKDSKAQPTN